MTATLIICDTCDFAAGEKLRDGQTGGEVLATLVESLAGGLPQVRVRRHSCLLGCERHCNIALSASGKPTYVLGRFSPGAEAAGAIVDFAAKYAASPTGQVPYRTWPEGVKGHFIARIPSPEGEGA